MKPKHIISYQLNSKDCPFISDENKCEIYEKRPLSCRAYPLFSKMYRIIKDIGIDCHFTILTDERCHFIVDVE